MTVQLVEKKVMVTKELSEVGTLLVAVLKDIKAGKPISETIGLELSKLMTAIDGMNLIGEEASNSAIYMTGATIGAEIVEALLVKPVVA